LSRPSTPIRIEALLTSVSRRGVDARDKRGHDVYDALKRRTGRCEALFAMTATSDELLLAIDCGTQSVRALLVDLAGEIVAIRRHAFEHYAKPQENWLEHDAEAFWQATADVCRGLWLDRPDLKSRVKGLAVTAQRGSLVLVDRDGTPSGPFIIWLDQRRASKPRPVPIWWRLAFHAARVAGTIDYLSCEAELNWLAEHEPRRLEKAHKVLLVSGWLNYRLTGRFVDSIGSQVGYLPFDFRRQDWAQTWNWKWSALAARRDQMAELAPVGSIIGGLTSAAAEATGLPEGLPVVAAAADKACEIMGAGAISRDVGAISYGTTATIAVTSPRYFEATPFLPPYPAVLPDHYSTEVQIYRGFWMVSWFKQQFGEPELSAALAQGVAPEALFDRLVEAVPPGSQGLMLQPYWTPGLRMPGPEARGAIIGFTDAHTRAHLYRAILEGLAYALREGRARIERRGGVAVTSLRVSGGGSQSDAAMQITADVFNLPASRPHTFEAAGLGAAMAAAVGLGLHPDFPAAVAAMTRQGRTFEPDPGRAALYDELYTRVYRRMYRRLGALYANLRRAHQDR
jgi:sugar (pentulose or hexulose) kinase